MFHRSGSTIVGGEDRGREALNEGRGAVDVMDPGASDASMEETLGEIAWTVQEDLGRIFGHEEAQVRVEEGPTRLIVQGDEGRFVVAWPPEEALTEAEGRLGAHARIAFEFVLASRAPGSFFEGYRPQTEERREILFDHVEAYIDDSLRENPYYTPLVVERRGPAMLVYGDDEYVLMAEDGSYRGTGILEWKVKRLIAFALTDTDEMIFGAGEAT